MKLTDSTGEQPASPPRLLLVAPGLVHPSRQATRCLGDALERVCSIPIERARAVSRLPRMIHVDSNTNPPPLAVILYLHRQNVPDGWMESLERFVSNGAGLLAIHSASASFKGDGRYAKLLGGVFAGHGPIETFEVKPVGSWVKTEGFTVRDERYTHRMTAEVNVHLRTDGEPVCWTRMFGVGRVAYLSLGHLAGVFRQDSVRRTVQQLVQWIVGEYGTL